LVKGKESKYCSDDCGVLFFQEQLQKTAGAKKASAKKSKKKSTRDDGTQDNVSGDEEEPTPLGGVIRAKDLKALAVASKDADVFKRLGSGVLSPPHTASPTRASFDGHANGTSNPTLELPFTRSEREHLGALRIEKEDLKVKLEILKDREKFVSMAREQATRYAENEKIKVKEFCGYDARLAWSDPEFLRWRESRFGRAAFKHHTLAPTAEQLSSVDADGDVQMDGVGGEDGGKGSICTKKRCTKHPQWQKLNLQDARFEEIEIVEAIKECEKSERSVCERARRRAQKDDMEAEVMGGEKSGERNREGWVQAVEA
jgi:COMPASS component SPP1